MKLYGKFDGEAITEISYNLKAFEEYDDIYYTTKEAVSIYDVYIPFEKNLDADWLPYNCTIVEDEIFFKDGKYYYEGIQDNIENYIEELIKEASPYNYSNGDIDAEDITELVTEDEFLEKFKKWYLSD